MRYLKQVFSTWALPAIGTVGLLFGLARAWATHAAGITETLRANAN